MTTDELSARGLRAKPLVWDTRGYSWATFADCYRIRREAGFGFFLDMNGDRTISGPHQLDADAKAAAEAHHAARIAAMIEENVK